MKVFNAIVGVLAIFGALYCIFWPEVAFLNAGWIVALVIFLWGACAIVTCLIDRRFHRKDGAIEVSGVLGVVFGVLACVLSVVATVSEVVEAIFLILVLILLMVFLGLAGLKNIIEAAKMERSKKPKGWLAWMVIGVVQLGLVLVGLLRWILVTEVGTDTHVFIGVLIGVFGLTLLGTVFAKEKIDRWGDL